MKKCVVVLLLLAVAVTAVQAQADKGPGFYVIPSAALAVGVNNYLRGGEAVCQALYDIGFLSLGVEVKADYDLTFNVFNVPMLLVVGFGRNFWLAAGYTLPAGSPSLTGTSGPIAWQLGGFPNTYEIGLNVLRFPTGIGTITIPTTISYTVNGPTNANDPLFQALGMLVGALAGLKATVGVGLELKAF
ncbi:MAG TPA: hypothetical protein VFH83_15690 [Spirochaetia bacterium]|nr:hypothetical protein [Spirochaetia bacterium]